MTTKQDLQNFRALRFEQKRLQEELTQIEYRLISLQSPVLTGLPSGGIKSSIDDKIASVERIHGKYKTLCNQCADEQARIENDLAKLDPTERNLIRLRYFDGLQWFEVARMLNYSDSMIYVLHGNILNKLKTL